MQAYLISVKYKYYDGYNYQIADLIESLRDGQKIKDKRGLFG